MKENSKVGVLIPLTWDEGKWEDGESFTLERSQFRFVKDYLITQEKIKDLLMSQME